jgi:endonuclease-3
MARESVAARRARALRIVKLLRRSYPDAACALHHRSAFELLVATILSAQCTDKKVNQVTPALFARFPDPAAMAAADPHEIERLIQPTGFFRQKTRSIQRASQDIVDHFGGRVPQTLADLVKLHGVGRKTANVVLGNAFDTPGLTVDTHMIRINRRLGLTRETDPVKIERDLMALVPEREWTLYSHRVIHHGRVCCEARRPRCETCPLYEECPWPRSAQARRRTPARRSGAKPRAAARGARPRKAGARR